MQGWNDLNQLIKISGLNRDLNQMIFLPKKIEGLNYYLVFEITDYSQQIEVQ